MEVHHWILILCLEFFFNYTKVHSLPVSGLTWQVQAKCRYVHEPMEHKTRLGFHRKHYAVSRNKNNFKMFIKMFV